MTETLLRYEFPSNEKLRTFLRLADLFKQLTWFAQQENSNDHRAAIIKYFEIQEVTTRGDQKMTSCTNSLASAPAWNLSQITTMSTRSL